MKIHKPFATGFGLTLGALCARIIVRLSLLALTLGGMYLINQHLGH